MEKNSIKENLPRLAFAIVLLSAMHIALVLAESDSVTKCTCSDEPTICPTYSTDASCIDRLPRLASPLDNDIKTKYKYYGTWGSKWDWTKCGGVPKNHVGIDLATQSGSDVYAVAAGTVKEIRLCSSNHNWAKYIVIDHDGLFTSVSEHVAPLEGIVEGQPVYKGQLIAKTEAIEPPQHLHFGIKCGGYEEMSKRGALPVRRGQDPCDYTSACKKIGCKCDTLYPGAFINPVDSRIIYEEHAAAGSSTDSTPPIVQSFIVTPLSVAVGESFSIEYTVLDTDNSGLKQVELWRKDGDGDWNEIKPPNTLAGENGPQLGSFTDSPSVPGTYWYGVHVVDNANNWNDERNSNTDSPLVSFVPVEVTVVSQDSVSSSIVGEWTLHSRRASDFIPSDSTITFNTDHTLRDTLYGRGTWSQEENTIHWEYDLCGEEICTRFKTTYDGTLDRDMKGTMQTCDGEEGDWSANRRYTEPGIMA